MNNFFATRWHKIDWTALSLLYKPNLKPMLTTLQLINHIASNPHYTTIAIDGCDDKKPMQAIELLSSESFANIWSINGSLEKNTLLVYDNSAFLKNDIL